VGVDDVLIVLAKQHLGGGADAIALLQLFAAAMGHPGALGRKAVHVVLLLLKQGLWDEHGQIDVLMPCRFEHGVQLMLDVFPNGVAIGAIDEHAFDGGVVNQLRLFAHVGIPLGKVHLHVGDLLHLLFVVLSHIISVLRLKIRLENPRHAAA
jgi:hypothetical protein